jgi:hypothetical protein
MGSPRGPVQAQQLAMRLGVSLAAVVLVLVVVVAIVYFTCVAQALRVQGRP